MKTAVMGFGTVGSGVVELLDMNRDSIALKSGRGAIDVKHILDLREFPDSKYAGLVTHDFNDILNDDEVEIVVETMGGLRPAFDFVKQCLEKGKHVVTSNKELVAAKGFELLETARKNNVNFFFEASVGGGIPIIRPLSQCLAANEIEAVAGILNGTTNFILTKMINEGMSFDDALKIAQELGYAEKDPTADVEGFDACRKICILASLAYGKHVYPDSVRPSGITKVTLKDVEYAKKCGCVIKLIASVEKLADGRISVCVSPAFVKNESMLARVDDVFNAVLVRGNALGDAVFYGRGAGKFPTASAVVADVIDCSNNADRTKKFGWTSDSEENLVISPDEVSGTYFVRGNTGKDRDAVIGTLKEKIGDIQILGNDGDADELAFITSQVNTGLLNSVLTSADGFDLLSVIRVTDY